MRKTGLTLERPILVSGVSFIASSSDEQQSGLLGWISATLNGKLRVDSIALRRTLDGRLAFSWPHRRDGSGRRHAILRPLNRSAQVEVERQLLRELRKQGHIE
jgi:hypothetical protein